MKLLLTLLFGLIMTTTANATEKLVNGIPYVQLNNGE